MPKNRVQPRAHEGVVLALLFGHEVREVRPGSEHARRPHNLPGNDEAEPQDPGNGRPARLPPGKEEGADRKLEDSGGERDVVGARVV